MLIDTKEASRRLGVCRTRVQQLLIAGRIPNSKKIGGEMRGTWVIEVHDEGPPLVLPHGKNKA